MDDDEWQLLKAELLWEFDRQLAIDQIPRWEDFVLKCPNSASKIELLLELVRCELAYQRWPTADLAGRIAFLSEQGADDVGLIKFLRGVFEDQVNAGEKPSWSEFRSFGFSEDDLCLRCDNEVLYLGLVLGTRWRLDQRVGEGAYGIVYRARDLATDTDVAIKEFRDAQAARKGSMTSLVEEELVMLSQLRHPAICRFLQAVTDPNGHVLAFVYQYVDGHTLRGVLRQGKLIPADAARIVVALADALDHVHQAGLVHCDVKPENVLIGEGVVPYITDFGFASSAARLFDLNSVAGTPGYMAPEVVVGPASQIDGRSDIWSLGAILFELLTGTGVGKPPASASDQEEEWPAFPFFVEERLRDICRRCLANRPNDRYDSAYFLARDLRQVLGEPIPQEEWHVPTAKLALDAWRAGFLLGTALDEHAASQQYLSKVTPHRRTGTDRRSTALRRTLEYERRAMEACTECIRLVDRMGLRVPSIDRTEGRVALASSIESAERGLLKEFRQFASRFGRELQVHSEEVGKELARLRQEASAFFNLAVNSALTKAANHPLRLLKLARSTGVSDECYANFLKAIRKKPLADVLRRERDRMGKAVERWLVCSMSQRGISG